ncbi:MAG TPA: hypothetical protein V6C65_36135 [Allocoleopsis sp.]
MLQLSQAAWTPAFTVIEGAIAPSITKIRKKPIYSDTRHPSKRDIYPDTLATGNL